MSPHKTRQARTINAAAITTLVCITGLSACGGGSDGGRPTPPPVTVPAAQAPSFTSQPQNQSVQAGQSVTFSATASGTDPLSYQWSRNGVAIPAATASAYTLAPAQLSDNAAVFSVTVRNAAGSADSAKAALTVTGTGLVTLAGAIAEKPGPDTPPTFDVMGSLSIDAAGKLFVAGGYNITSIDSAGTIRRLPVDPVCNTWAAGHDKAGNVHVSCWAAIYKVSPAGVVSLVAGNRDARGAVDAQGAAARFDNPQDIAVDANGIVYISDQGREAASLRRIDAAGNVSTMALHTFRGGTGGGKPITLRAPSGLAIDAAGNVLLIEGNLIYKIAADGTATIVAGSPDGGWADGDAFNARFSSPSGLAIDAAGTLYVSDTGNASIRTITADGKVRTLAGRFEQIGSADGQGNKASFNLPRGIDVDAAGNVFVNDAGNKTVRKITPAGVVTTVAGTPVLPRSSGSIDGLAQDARFYAPKGIAADATGNVFIADSLNHAIRRISPDGAVTTLAGSARVSGTADGTAGQASFRLPAELSIDASGNLFVFDMASSQAPGISLVRKVSPAGVATTVQVPVDPRDVTPAGKPATVTLPTMTTDAAGNIYLVSTATNANNYCPTPKDPGFCDSLRRIALRRIAADGSVTTLAENYNGTSPGVLMLGFRYGGMAVDNGGAVYLSDLESNVIWKVSGGAMTIFAGVPGKGGASDGKEEARFSTLGRMAFDKAGNLFVADTGNFTIRKITPAGVVSTPVGTAGKNDLALGSLPGSLPAVSGIAFDAKGVMYLTVADGIIKVVLP
ncbi:hypothetical protein RBA41_26450 [Massilia sp. CCM 9210]|uniref:immunoglobulin domain-containing protein n=1 Tax=Massilia scottii TaxID=3057166 RepID=UPI002796C3E4|nr:immunoglobulin domain-containing protein [Massilia sp. CCM 9210]MDQ1816850.1 hypothetical protein [Massilia sp. CCM 9210]